MSQAFSNYSLLISDSCEALVQSSFHGIFDVFSLNITADKKFRRPLTPKCSPSAAILHNCTVLARLDARSLYMYLCQTFLSLNLQSFWRLTYQKPCTFEPPASWERFIDKFHLYHLNLLLLRKKKPCSLVYPTQCDGGTIKYISTYMQPAAGRMTKLLYLGLSCRWNVE